jgi:PKD repeat protein
VSAVLVIFYSTLLTGQAQIDKTTPKANAGIDLRVLAGDEVTLDGNGSSGTVLKSFWDFDDRNGIENESENLRTKHTYKKPGTYIATLTTTDKYGKVSWDKKIIEVLTPPTEGLNITDNFEGGYIGQTYRMGNTYRCHLLESASWTVRIDNCEGVTTTLKIFGFGKNNPAPLAITHYKDQTFSQNFRAVFSYEFGDQNWEVLKDAKYKYFPETESMEITAVFKKSPVYIGWSYLNTPSMLQSYLANLPNKKFLNIASVGKSVQGREIPMVTIGDPDIEKEMTVWITGGQHGMEVAGVSASEGLIDFLISDDPVAREARSKIEFKIIPLTNPDANARKLYRYNVHGIDLNRNWDSIDNGNGHDSPIAEPEVAEVKKTINSWVTEGKKRSIFIDIHDWDANGSVLLVSPIGDTNLDSPENKLFYQEITRKYLPYYTFYYNKPEPGSVDATGANASAWFHLNVPGNELSVLIEMGLHGLVEDPNLPQIPALPENIKYVGKQFAEMSLEYFNSSKK